MKRFKVELKGFKPVTTLYGDFAIPELKAAFGIIRNFSISDWDYTKGDVIRINGIDLKIIECNYSECVVEFVEDVNIFNLKEFEIENGVLLKYNKQVAIVIPDSVTTIGNSVFESNELKSVTIGKNVVSIGDFAFYENDLTSVTILSSITTIGRCAFGRNDLTDVIIQGDKTRFNNRWESIGFPIELMPK